VGVRGWAKPPHPNPSPPRGLCTKSRGTGPSPPLGRPVRHKWRTTNERRWATSSSHRMPLILVRHSATHPRGTPPTAFLCKAPRGEKTSLHVLHQLANLFQRPLDLDD